jgi:hypothetical protein
MKKKIRSCKILTEFLTNHRNSKMHEYNTMFALLTSLFLSMCGPHVSVMVHAVARSSQTNSGTFKPVKWRETKPEHFVACHEV